MILSPGRFTPRIYPAHSGRAGRILDKPRGAHGYDNRYQSMQATFIAHGESFKRGFIAQPFENIHVYSLMCKILGLTPAKNDGNLDAVRNMLK